jgi:hypothetical protein
MYQLNPIEVRTFNLLNEEPDKEQNASKMQGTPPGAQEACPKKRPPCLTEEQAGTRRG